MTLPEPPKNILVPIDLSEVSESVVAEACLLAQKTGADLHLLHVYFIPVESVGLAQAVSERYVREFVADARAQLEALLAKHCLTPTKREVLVESGDPRDVIVSKAAELHADLIVMGTHRRRGLTRVLLGSVAESVIRTAPCSVLVVR